jgi:hypothetical protein
MDPRLLHLEARIDVLETLARSLAEAAPQFALSRAIEDRLDAIERIMDTLPGSPERLDERLQRLEGEATLSLADRVQQRAGRVVTPTGFVRRMRNGLANVIRGGAALALACMMSSTPAAAQTPGTHTLVWDYLNTSTAVVATYTHVITVDGSVRLGPVTCAPMIGTPTTTTCAFVLAPALMAGTHTLRVMVTAGGGFVEGVLANFDPSRLPSLVNGLRVVVSVTVTVP